MWDRDLDSGSFPRLGCLFWVVLLSVTGAGVFALLDQGMFTPFAAILAGMSGEACALGYLIGRHHERRLNENRNGKRPPRFW